MIFNLSVIRPYRLMFSAVVLLVAVAASGCARREESSTAQAGQAGETAFVVISSAEDFAREVEGSSTPVLVDFWATWCPPCRAMEPVLADTATRYRDVLRVAKVDIDKNRDLADRFKIRAVPTMILYYQGKGIAMTEGAIRQQALLEWIQHELADRGVELTLSAP